MSRRESPTFKLRERYWSGTWQVRVTLRDVIHVRLEGTKRECREWLVAHMLATTGVQK